MGGACWCCSVLIDLEESTADRSAYSAVISMARPSLKRYLPCSFAATFFTPIGSVLCRLCSSAESFPQQTLLSWMIVSSDVRDIVRHTSDGLSDRATRVGKPSTRIFSSSYQLGGIQLPLLEGLSGAAGQHKELDQGRKRRPRSHAGRE